MARGPVRLSHSLGDAEPTGEPYAGAVSWRSPAVALGACPGKPQGMFVRLHPSHFHETTGPIEPRAEGTTVDCTRNMLRSLLGIGSAEKAPSSWKEVPSGADIAKEQLSVWPLDEHNVTLLDNVAPSGWTNPRPHAVYDLIAIGAGSGGLVSSKQAARRGAKSALIEMHLAGGDCLNVGCVPSKALIRSARAIKDIRRSDELGIRVEGTTAVDFGAIMERMRRLRAAIAPADSYEGTAAAGARMFSGRAVFTGPNSLKIVTGDNADIHLSFRKAVISTGGKPVTPPLYAGVPHFTNETLFNLTNLPPRMVVIGGGPIGLEMAQCFAVFGSKVTVLIRGAKILPKEDADAAEIVHKALVADGIDIITHTTVEAAERTGKVRDFPNGERLEEVALTCKGPDGKTFDVHSDVLLVAAGRKPNVKAMGLEEAGVEYDDRTGVHIDDLLRTTNPNVYAVGDVAHKFQFTHMSGEMAKMAVENALFDGDWRLADLAVPWCTYTMPEVAHVGMYEHDLKAKGYEAPACVLRAGPRV